MNKPNNFGHHYILDKISIEWLPFVKVLHEIDGTRKSLDVS